MKSWKLLFVSALLIVATTSSFSAEFYCSTQAVLDVQSEFPHDGAYTSEKVLINGVWYIIVYDSDGSIVNIYEIEE